MKNKDMSAYLDQIIDEYGLTLESILAEYKAQEEQSGKSGAPKTEARQRSRAIVMEAMSDTIQAAKLSSADHFQTQKVSIPKEPPPEKKRQTLWEDLPAEEAVRAFPAPKNQAPPPGEIVQTSFEDTRGYEYAKAGPGEKPAWEDYERLSVEDVLREDFLSRDPELGPGFDPAQEQDIHRREPEAAAGEDFAPADDQGGYDGYDDQGEYDGYDDQGGYDGYDDQGGYGGEERPGLLGRLLSRLWPFREAEPVPEGEYASFDPPAEWAQEEETAPSGDAPGREGETRRTAFEFIGFDGGRPEVSGEAPGQSADGPDPQEELYGYDDREGEEYAGADYPRLDPREARRLEERYYTPGRGFLRPVIGLLAAIVTLRQQHSRQDPEQSEPEPERDAPDLPPDQAARHYTGQIKPLKLRGTLAAAVCAVLLYISYGHGLGLPLPGALGTDLRLASAMCLLLLLCVMVLGLDVLTNGILSIVRGKPRAESLIAISCLASVLDVIFILSYSGYAHGLPFCAVPALSLAFAIWGSRLTCSAYRTTFKAAARADAPYLVTAQWDSSQKGGLLVKFRREPRGFVRRSEEADVSETAHTIMAPFMMVACLVLALLASVFRKNYADFFHAYSAITAACASFSALIAFPLPFSIISKKLMQSGAAVAGCAGAADVGKSRRVIITDGDLFPPGTLALDGMHITEGHYTDKVISYTGSVLAAGGGGLSPLFSELMRQNACTLHRVEEFSCHEGGGLVAFIRGEQVHVGSSGFMNLMGIRQPQNLSAKNLVYTAINGQLAGMFSVSYTPVSSVQDALVTLTQSRLSPYFAIRDFNITPLLLKKKFRLPAGALDFPSFTERYKLSAIRPPEDSPPAAALSREGLGPMVDACTGGRRLYDASRFCALISLIGSFAGLILMFFLCWSGAYDAATVGNILSFMLLWLIPILVITTGLRR